VRVVDLTTEDVVELGSGGDIHGDDAIRGDGRYAYLTDGDAVRVVDSGAWQGGSSHARRSSSAAAPRT